MQNDTILRCFRNVVKRFDTLFIAIYRSFMYQKLFFSSLRKLRVFERNNLRREPFYGFFFTYFLPIITPKRALFSREVKIT